MGAPLKADPLPRALRLAPDAPYRRLVGVGGIGAGLFFALEGNHDLGRNESRPGRLLDVRDYCKLHIVAQYPTVLLGAREDSGPFHVVPVGKVGIDEVGLRLRAEMERAGMDVRFVDAVPGRPTLLSVCFQYPDGSGGNITTVDSAAALVGERDVDLVERWLSPTRDRPGGPRGAARGPPPPAAPGDREGRPAGRLPHHGRDRGSARDGLPVPRGPPGPERGRGRGARRRSLPGRGPRALPGAARGRRDGFGAGVRLVVTAGARGAFAFDGAAWAHVPALPVAVVSTAGAGDALLGGVLTGLAAGLPFAPAGSPPPSLAGRPLSSALELGALVAAFKVTSPHTIPPDLSLDALVAFAREHGVAFGDGLRRLLPADEEHRHAS